MHGLGRFEPKAHLVQPSPGVQERAPALAREGRPSAPGDPRALHGHVLSASQQSFKSLVPESSSSRSPMMTGLLQLVLLSCGMPFSLQWWGTQHQNGSALTPSSGPLWF